MGALRHLRKPDGYGSSIVLSAYCVTKNGYTRAVFSKNGYSRKSSRKRTPRAIRLVKNKSQPFSRGNGTGAPITAYLAYVLLWFSTVFFFQYFFVHQLPIIACLVLITAAALFLALSFFSKLVHLRTSTGISLHSITKGIRGFI